MSLKILGKITNYVVLRILFTKNLAANGMIPEKQQRDRGRRIVAALNMM
jgi:hypothetical protein